MNIYAQLLDGSKVGATVGITYQKGVAVASAAINHGKFGIVRSVNKGVAFVEIVNDARPNTMADAGSALGVSLDLPVSAEGYLTVTVEDN
jgi:hypothetical protein